MQPVDQIKSYLDGKTKIAAFYDAVTKDKQLQAYIEQATDIPPYTNDGDLLLYILNQNPAAVASDINIKDALAKFLKVMGVEHQVDQTSLDRYELVLDATPAWLSLPDSYIDILLENIPTTLGRTARVKAIKNKISDEFRYLKKPPKWLQEPAWMFAGDRPLIFIGQLDLGDLLHDDAQVYVFFDNSNQAFLTVKQCA
jgi:hypothetical protein